MEEWYAKDFIIELNLVNSNSTLPLNCKFSSKPSRPSKAFINFDFYKNLNKHKDQISNLNNWEKWSRLVNPYEKITKIGSCHNHQLKTSTLGQSLDDKRVRGHASRAYFKMYEIIKYFDLLPDTHTHTDTDTDTHTEEEEKGECRITSGHLCEAPGGFIKAIINLCYKNNYKLDWVAQTLYEGTAALVVDESLNIPEKMD